MLIYHIISHNQPAIFAALCKRYPLRQPAQLVSVWVEDMPFEMWRALQQEKPMPGRGGLLSGEKGVREWA